MDIRIEHISKSFDKKTKVLNDLCVTIDGESLTTLLGFSGCGKTTLLRLIAGLEEPDTGRILFGDKVVFDKEKKVNLSPIERGIGFVFQDFALWPNMTVLENVEFGIRSQLRLHLKNKQGKVDLLGNLKRRRKAIKERAMEVLAMVKMAEFSKRLPSELSGGQKQRIAIARAIAIRPQVILFDEPLSALDALLREEMRTEIKDLVHELKMTAIFVTHDQVEAMSISNDVIVMNKGTIAGKGKSQDIYWHPQSAFIANFIGKASWLSETQFLRPEDVHLQRKEEDLSLDLMIEEAECQGGKYLAIGKTEDGRKIFFTMEEQPEVGNTIKLFYSKNNIRTVGANPLKASLCDSLVLSE